MLTRKLHLTLTPRLPTGCVISFHTAKNFKIKCSFFINTYLQTLFDRGLLTINTDNRIEVSSQIKETWGNGKHYYALYGQELQITPKSLANRPAPEFVEWHNAEVFRK